MLYAQRHQADARMYQPIIALYLITPDPAAAGQLTKCYPSPVIIMKKQASTGLKIMATALGKTQFFCTLKD